MQWIGSETDSPDIHPAGNLSNGYLELELRINGETLHVKSIFDLTGHEDPRHTEMALSNLFDSTKKVMFKELKDKGIAYGL